jgi:hypothetical protein
MRRGATLEELCAGFVDYKQTSDPWLCFCADQHLTDPREVSPDDHSTDYADYLVRRETIHSPSPRDCAASERL